jgi:hypothetical protein
MPSLHGDALAPHCPRAALAPSRQRRRAALLGAGLLLASLCGLSAPALAVPSFARQTGYSCAQCHTAFPELTPLGRAFKAGGYTLTLSRSISDKDGDRQSLDLPGMPPLAGMIQTSFTHTAQAQGLAGAGKPQAKNDDVLLPEQFSLFYAGKVAPKLGAFVQVTYDGIAGSLAIDNADLRFAHPTKLLDQDVIVGLTLNNNPSVQDLWNSSPAWGVPYASSPVAPSPAASTLVAGGLAQSVAGLGAYLLWNNTVYAELTAYKAAPLGTPRPLQGGTAASPANVVDGLAPYWRLALTHDFEHQSIMIGTYGLMADLLPGGSGSPLEGPTDHFLDLAVDAQWQYFGEEHVFSAVFAYVHESRSLNATQPAGGADNHDGSLGTVMASAGWLWHRLLGARLTLQTVAGSGDGTLYAPTPVTGSASGSPNSSTASAELLVQPWLNTQFTLRYQAWGKFNGASSNYDGSGRDASANNALYLLAWIAF